jgi:hypothetical protein
MNNDMFYSKNASTKNKMWLALEKELYTTWSNFHPEKSSDDFYREQQANSITINGIIEPYNQSIKNRPGDYILKNEDLPIAYLYSINVDLEKFKGKKISISVSPRPNNNFAFPAYFVNSIK